MAALAGTRTAARDLRLLAAGIGVSAAGDTAALVALLLRLRPEGSGWVAALLAAQLLPVVLLAPLVGQLVDRIETRRVLLVAVAGQAAAAVPLALVSGPEITIALFLVVGIFNAAVRPATNAMVPAVVGEDRATHGYARVALGQNFGWIAGPVAGGLLVSAFGTRTALLLDAGTFAALAVACLLIRARRRPRAYEDDDAEGASGRRGQARLGFQVLWGDRVLRVVVVVSAISVACAVIDNVAAPFRFVDQLGTTSTGYGIYLALWGVGVLAGSQLPPRIPSHHAHLVPVAGHLLCSVGIVGIGLSPTVALAFVASVAGGVGNGLANVSQNALVGTRVPEHQRGRAFAANGAILNGGNATGTAAAGPIVALLGAGTAMAICGTLGALAAAAGLVALRGDASPPGAQRKQQPSPR
jgi:MFS family permease